MRCNCRKKTSFWRQNHKIIDMQSIENKILSAIGRKSAEQYYIPDIRKRIVLTPPEGGGDIQAPPGTAVKIDIV